MKEKGNEKKNRKRFRPGRFCLWFFILLVLVLCITPVLLFRTQFGVLFIENTTNRILNREGRALRMEIAGLSGSLPFDIHLGRFAARDGEGLFLDAENIVLTLSFMDLLRGCIHVEEISAKNLAFYRKPVLSLKEEKPKKTKGFSLPSLPEILVDKLLLEEIFIGKDVLGENTVLHLEGFLANDKELLSSRLSLHSLEGLSMELLLEAAFGHQSRTLDLRGEFSEKKGQLSTLLKLPPLPLSLKLDGKGEPGEWLGRLDFLAGNNNSLGTDLGIVWEKTWPTIMLTGKITMDPDLLPGTIYPFLAVMDLEGQFFEDPEKNGLFTDVTIKNDKMELDLKAGFLHKKKEIEADLLLTLAKPEELSPVEKLSPGSEILLQARARGAMMQPEIEGRLILVEPSFDKLRFDRLELKSDVKLQLDKTKERKMHCLGTLEAAGFIIGERAAPAPILSDLDFTYLFSEKNLLVDHLEITSRDLLARAKGSIVQNRKVYAEIDLDLDHVGSWAALVTDMPVAGKGRVSVKLGGAFSPLKFGMEILANLENLEGLPDPIAGLAGEQVTLQGKTGVERTESKDLRFAVLDMKMTGSNLSIVTDGFFSKKRDDISLITTLNIHDLAPLFPRIGMGGKAELRGDLTGKPSDFSFDLVLSSKDFSLPQTGVLPLRLSIRGNTKNAKTGGDLLLEAETPGSDSTVKSDFFHEGKTLQVPLIKAVLPGLHVGGHGDVNLAKPVITAEFDGVLEDAEKLGAIAGLHFAGNGTFNASFFGSETGQNLGFNTLFSSLRLDALSLASLEAKGRLQDLFGKKHLTADYLAKDLEAGSLVMEESGGRIQGNLPSLSFATRTKGDAFGPLVLDLNGGYAQGNADQIITFTRFEGTWSEIPFRLEKNWDLSIKNGGISTGPLQFRFEEATLQASGVFKPKKLTLDLNIENFPAHLLPLNTQGKLRADLHMEGTPASPAIRLEFSGKEIGPQDSTYYDGPGIMTLVRSNFQGQELSFDLKLWEISEETPFLSGSGSLPMILSLKPFKLELKKNTPVKAKLDGIASLDRLGLAFMPADQLLRGDMTLNLALSGNLAKPLLSGDVKLARASYQHLEHGVFLKNMDTHIQLSPERLDLVGLSANDVNGGRLEGSGTIGLKPETHFPFDIFLTTGGFQVLNSPTIFAVLKDADINFSGNMKYQHLKGEINLGRLEYFIRDFGGPSIPNLKVTEIPAPEGQKDEKSNRERPFSPRLDLKINFPGKLFVRGRGLDSEWGGALQISGMALNPGIRGAIELVRGRMDFLGKRLDLEEGKITLDGSRPPNPHISVTAEQDGKDVRSILKIEGHPSHLKFSLSSEPSLPEDEVLSHILFGRSIAAISPLQAAQLAWAIGELSGYTDGPGVFGMARDFLGLDDLNIVSNGNDPDDIRLRAGKYVQERVYLRVEKDLKTDDDLISADVELSRRLSFESKLGPKGGGVGLYWKRDF